MTAPHPSLEYRWRPDGIAPDGTLNYRSESIPCGNWVPAIGTVLCQEHLDQAREWYPQGWDYYPGDICPHGIYTGGCGIDWTCGACEMGED